MTGTMERNALPLGVRIDSARTYARRFLPAPSGAPRPFFIFGQGRSGSTLLCNLLNSHPDVYCESEILYHRRLAPLSFALGRRNRAPSDKMYGFKVKVYQLDDVQTRTNADTFVHQLANDHRWRLIFLWRKEILRQTVSAIMAWKKGLWHAQKNEQEAVERTVRLDPDHVIDSLHFRIRNLKRERELIADLPHEVVTYETDLLLPEDQQPTLSRLFTFLDLPDHQVETSLRKTSKPDPSTQIENFDEIRDAILENGLGEYL